MIIKPDAQPPRAEVGDGAPELVDVSDVRSGSRVVSGLYVARAQDVDDVSIQVPGGVNDAEAASPVAFASSAGREELRLDVDGYHPQRIASGVAVFGTQRVAWIASLVPVGTNRWTGPIFYKDGPTAAFPYTTAHVRIISDDHNGHSSVAELRLEAPGGLRRRRRLRYRSRYFHNVDFEFDAAQGEAPTTEIQTCAHPNRPPALPCEDLSIRKVFRRAGFNVSESPGGTVPISGAGAGARWSDAEMHDAMQVFWSNFSATAQWAMWVFFASLHEQGTSLGGIMFDDIGPQHRQGTAIFNDAFISVPPSGDPNPAAWVQRMIFWTACHEMGHAFNLAHSWQKSLGTPWVPGLANEPEARSFMNYPFRVSGGQAAFFADFEYRFSNAELLFLRHAPERFVQMGNADWFDHHGFENALVSPQPTLRLELRVNRAPALFEFLEPVTLELKLTNVSTDPQVVDANLLGSLDAMTVVIKPHGKAAREFVPFARRCYQPEKTVLGPGESMYAPLGVSAGLNGWDLADPGRYVVQVALRREGEDVVSNPLPLRVAPPRDYDEELVAQDVFTEDVGRTLALGGTEVLTHANDVLHGVVERLGERRAAIHAALALAEPAATTYKVPRPSAEAPAGLEILARKPRAKEARDLLERAVVDHAQHAVETLGHIEYVRRSDAAAQWLADADDPKAAAELQAVTYETLSEHAGPGGKVLRGVLDDIASRRDRYQAKAKPAKQKSSR